MMNGMKQKNLGLITSIDFKLTHIKVIYISFLAVLTILALMCLLPVVWVFLSAFKDFEEFIQVPPTIIPKSFNINKLGEVWSELKLGRYYINSIIYVVGCWFFNVTFNGLAGYVLSKVKPVGYKGMIKIVFLCMLLPTTMNMIPLYISFVDFPLLHIDITDSYLPLWFMHGVSPFTIILFKNFFDGIPRDYYEAAKIDGCSEVGIFLRIMIPLALPIILVVSILCINTSWAEFMWPYLVIKDPQKYPVSVIVYKMSTEISIDKYYIVLLLSILPPLGIFVVFGKKMMGGLSMGGVKG